MTRLQSIRLAEKQFTVYHRQEQDMTTLYHPTIPDVTVELDDKDLVERHVDQGWKKSEPKAAKEAREAAGSAEA